MNGEDMADPWWWSQESSMSASGAQDDFDAAKAQMRLQTGEVVYNYGLSPELTMEVVQLVVEGFETKSLSLEQICVNIQLVGLMGEPLGATSVSTGCSFLEGKHRARWSEHVSLPFKISDVPENAVLELTLWGPAPNSHSHSPQFLGVAKFPLFSREGRLRTGKQELEVYSSWFPASCSPQQREEEYQRLWCNTTIEYEREETKRKEANKCRVEWLNRMAEDRLIQLRRARRTLLREQVVGILAVEFFDYGVPIIFESGDEEQHSQNLQQYHFGDDPAYRPSPGGEVLFPELAALFRGETAIRNVVEEKCYAMRRSLTRKSGGEDPNLRPNVHDLAQIERILSSLSKPRSEDEDLLWKFRHSLVRTSKALTKVLASVKWDDDEEVAQASKLLEKWESAEVCDVLRLLSGEPEFSHPVVRTYAVKVLAGTGNSILLLYMPQLVQALRYDIAPLKDSTSTANATVTATGIVEEPKEPGPLQRFLVLKCAGNDELASGFHWLLKVECALAKSTASPALDIFTSVAEAFRKQTARHPHVLRAIQAQDEFVGRYMTAARAAASVSRSYTERTKAFLAALEQEPNGPYTEPIPLAGFPGKRIIRVKKETARIMKSTTCPAVIDFVLQESPLHTTGVAASIMMDESIASIKGGATPTMTPTVLTAASSLVRDPPTIRIMFKVGDDLRQDQLILQLIELMDNIFRENGLDLEMTIYRVLATAPLEGLVEFVPDAMPLTKVKDEYNSIANFLARNEAQYGGKRAVVERFTRSCAGYAVATYVLGIGDRHLDNIMLRPNGHMFHIDFGFAFGRDPKSFASPVRITSEMIEAMGGEDGERSFRRHCWEALKALRGQAALILSVIGLMADASIPDLSKLQMTSNVLSGIQERLKLGLSDEEAERSFNAVLDESISALGPVFIEYFHHMAQQLRS